MYPGSATERDRFVYSRLPRVYGCHLSTTAWLPASSNSVSNMSDDKDAMDFDVVIVGAGISGINFAYRLQQSHPDLKYCILEGRHEIGGTWSLFKYPVNPQLVHYVFTHRVQPNSYFLGHAQVSDPTPTSSRLVLPGDHGQRSNPSPMAT